MADETPALDCTSIPTSIEWDDPEGEWTTPENVRKPRLAARPSFDLHAVGVHLPALPSATSAELLDILPAFIRAGKLPADTCADVSVHLRNRNHLAILKAHHMELVSRLLSVESIVLAGRIYAVASYLAATTNSCRGVIYGVAPDATPEELLRDLDCYQADIPLARRVGNANSALITFAGMHILFSVYYQRLEFRCHPHKPRAHHYTICLQYGHRTCACPGNQRLCPTCSTPITEPDEPHSYSPRDRQLGRLSSSAQGHWLLQRAGIRPIDFPLYTPQRPLPSNLRCAPTPSNMTPHLHEGRRQARAHFPEPFPPDTVTCYVDAAYYQTHGSTACVTMPTPLGIPITSTAGPFSLPTSSLSLELAAIVHVTHELTLLPPSPRYRICSDSMAAIRALRDNRLPDNLHDDLSDALSLLSPALVTVVWVPGHAGIIGNKLAHELAREINSWAPTILWPCPAIADEAHFYKKTLKQHYIHLRHSLQTLPPPHPRLSTVQVRTLRAIQLNTLITPARLYLYRYRSDPSCPNCPSTYANVEHIIFSCPAALQSPHYPNPPPPHWRVWLASAAFTDQLAMVLLAEEYL
ncbi:hypothetical protein HPB49_004997 [Dermacentor silvarum]|uniref:Uncharacterized protein n=1 Tax=Dermacentor silvarum TaxID=543639 RepID=A0ACB8DAR0_DERSI|nr:hypothetical protein HPB49_004997 [Dermacentor silvarum]